jgi:hypothetical protein
MKQRNRYRLLLGASALPANPAGETPTEAPVEESKGPRQVIEQAARDIGRGLRDTDLHGTPSNVPGPGPNPEHSPGAEVPPEGVKVNK